MVYMYHSFFIHSSADGQQLNNFNFTPVAMIFLALKSDTLALSTPKYRN